VTCYQTQTYYEPVTTYVTRTYYQPVTTYRYSCYYDPCTCSYQQVAVPCTSYVARQQCCPVQTWVQRCCKVPVTTYQKSCYWEPQTTCCTTSGGGGIVTMPPAVDGKPYQPPQIEEKGGVAPKYEELYGGGAKDMSQKPERQLVPVPVKPAPTAKPPAVKLDRIALGDGTVIQGQVVSDKNAPKGGTQLTFVSAQKQTADKNVTANASGEFEIELPPGGWYVYVRSNDGTQVYHSRIEIEAKQKTPIVLVSR
jgi:hypothetical protein